MALTPKQESFAQAVVSGMTQSDAYRSAYSAGKMKAETIQRKACELMKDGKITARVEELRKPVVEKLQYDLEKAMGEAQEAFEVARDKENGGAMVAAVTLRAKLNGLLVERKEITINPIETMTEDALQQFITRKAIEAGVSLH